jgi:hypothetical protein
VGAEYTCQIIHVIVAGGRYKSAGFNKFVLVAMTIICTCSVGGGGVRGDSYKCNV